MSESIDFAKLLAPVALKLLGEPRERTHGDKEWRYGRRGSFHVRLDKGTWIDHTTEETGGTLALIQRERRCDKSSALRWLHDEKLIEAPATGTRANIIAVYDYCDAAGALLFQVVRYAPKTFRQRRPDGAGGWIWKMAGVALVPFRLPQVLAAVAAGRTIFIVEGEKAAIALERLGVVATCSAGGAGKWRAAYNAHFAGADVVILPDNDPQQTGPDGSPRWHPDKRPVLPGQDHAADVARQLAPIAASVKLLMLPGLPAKGDAFDWVEAGHGAAELARLVEAAPPWRPAEAAATPQPAVATVEDWRGWLQRDERGAALANLANAMTALRHAPELRDHLSFDEMAQAAVLTKPLPGAAPGELPRAVTDGDASRIQEWLQTRGDLRRIGRDTVFQAIEFRAEERRFHPVRNYLAGLRWDGRERLQSWLPRYLGADAGDYVARIGALFLIGMVARVMRPGCKADYLLVLEGPQGARKSTACAILGGAWFSDSLPDLRQVKDASLHLAGRWLIEIPELSAVDRAEAATIKAFVTRAEERYRPSYARKEIVQPRQCMFIATTNKAVYLRDETGGRRFWPVKVGAIDTERLRADRDQLFAEAVRQFEAGAPWWPDAEFERGYISKQQDSRYESDAWEEQIHDWLSRWAADAVPEYDPPLRPFAADPSTTILTLARRALHIDVPRLGTADQRRIAAALERLGWRRASIINGVQRWRPDAWTRGPAPGPPDPEAVGF